MKSKRIIHLITTIERGGAERQLLTLVNQQIRSGLEVEIFFLTGSPELRLELENYGAKVRLDMLNKNFVHQFFLFRKYIKFNSAPVHAHLPKSELLAALSCQTNGFVFTRHNSEPFWPGAPKLVSNSLSKFVEKRSAFGICISNAVKDYIIARGEIEHSENLATIYYGFEPKHESNITTELTNLDFNTEAKRVFKLGCIGRLVRQKNYPVLFRSIQLLIQSKIKVELFIAGEGKDKAKLNQLAYDLEIESNVHFLGKIDLVDHFLSSLDVFVLPSIYEGFGLVLLEAMQAKVPIIASGNTSIPEVLGSDYPGLFDAYDFNQLSMLLKKVLNNISFRTNLVSIYTTRLEIFKPEKMASQIFKVYERAGF
jgi:glycosyltransferase involved in cell wall biosynthesis